MRPQNVLVLNGPTQDSRLHLLIADGSIVVLNDTVKILEHSINYFHIDFPFSVEEIERAP